MGAFILGVMRGSLHSTGCVMRGRLPGCVMRVSFHNTGGVMRVKVCDDKEPSYWVCDERESREEKGSGTL